MAKGVQLIMKVQWVPPTLKSKRKGYYKGFLKKWNKDIVWGKKIMQQHV
jgi:hypothetical protein